MTEIDKSRSARQHLLDELAERKGKNPSYSLRAFARDLGISVTALSEVLNEKRSLSHRNITKMAERLCLSPAEIQAFSKAGKYEAHLVEEDTFRIMSDWYYFAILSLARVSGAKGDVSWVAKRLGISETESKVALERLERLGFIDRKGGNLKRTVVPLRTTAEVPSSALRKFHSQHLALATQALEDVAVESREITSMTMAIDPKRIKEAKEKILMFRNQLSDFLEGGTVSEVYSLAIQLFPLKASRSNS